MTVMSAETATDEEPVMVSILKRSSSSCGSIMSPNSSDDGDFLLANIVEDGDDELGMTTRPQKKPAVVSPTRRRDDREDWKHDRSMTEDETIVSRSSSDNVDDTESEPELMHDGSEDLPVLAEEEEEPAVTAPVPVVQPTQERPQRQTSSRASLRGLRASLKGRSRPNRIQSATSASMRERMGLGKDPASARMMMMMMDSSSSSNNYDDDDEEDARMGNSSTPSSSSRRRRGVPSRSHTMDARVSAGRATALQTMKQTTATSNKASPTKKRPSRIKSSVEANPKTPSRQSSKSGGGLRGSLRRNHTVDERVKPSSSSSSSSMMEKMFLRSPSGTSSARRQRMADDALMGDSSAEQQSSSSSSSRRSSLRRNKTLDERQRTTPRRTFSAFGLPQRTRSSKRHSNANNPAVAQRPPHSLNIFGSDLVSTEFMLSKLDELEANPDIVLVELEDCWSSAARRGGDDDDDDDDDLIPVRLREILLEQIRPWEGIHFVDELFLNDMTDYKEFKKRRKRFLKAMDGVCAQRVIPVQYKVKVHVTDDDDDDDDDDNDTAATKDGTSMITLLRDLGKDPSVTSLHFTTRRATLAVVEALKGLLERNDRDWETLALTLSSDGMAATITPTEREALQAATQSLHQLAQSKGIDVLSHQDS